MTVDPTHNLPGQIIAVLDELETATHDYGVALRKSNASEADYRLAFAGAAIKLADGAVGKMTVATREAHALLQSRHEYQRWMIDSAVADSSRQLLYSLRAKLDALRTLNANVRALTDPRLPS